MCAGSTSRDLVRRAAAPPQDDGRSSWNEMTCVRVLYDDQIFSLQTHGGISRYFAELLGQFGHAEELRCRLALRCSNNEHLCDGPAGRGRTFFPKLPFRGKPRLLVALNRAVSRRALAAGDFDVFHPTYYHPYFLKYLDGKPFVLTIHDLTHEVLPQDFPARRRTSANMKLLAQKAARIIAVSETTRRDIVRFLGQDEEKIEVIYHGNPLHGLPAVAPGGLSLPRRYVLFVGHRARYKNFDLLVKALRPLFVEDEELTLICAGGSPFVAGERLLFRELGMEGRVRRVTVSDEALAFVYREALALVFPSRYEGFGIPVLEALGCGCPAILSRVGALVEAGGPAAVYFDPGSETSLREALRRVIFDEAVRSDLRQKGYVQGQRFSWEETARRTAAAYRSVL
jgi:glycosyltransferase involved in cell wall biosynthesis